MAAGEPLKIRFGIVHGVRRLGDVTHPASAPLRRRRSSRMLTGALLRHDGNRLQATYLSTWGPRNGPHTPNVRSAPGDPWRSSVTPPGGPVALLCPAPRGPPGAPLSPPPGAP